MKTMKRDQVSSRSIEMLKTRKRAWKRWRWPGSLGKALESLATTEMLVVQFRYEEGMTLGEIAEMLGWEEREAVNLHKSALYKLKKLVV